MYFVLCDGAESALSRWSELVRSQAERLKMNQDKLAVIASNKWGTPAVGGQVWEKISRSASDDTGVLVFSSDAWRSLLYNLPKPVEMDSGRVRFTMTIETGKSAVGLKVEMPKPTPHEILECLNWLTKEVELHAGIRSGNSRAE